MSIIYYDKDNEKLGEIRNGKPDLARPAGPEQNYLFFYFLKDYLSLCLPISIHETFVGGIAQWKTRSTWMLRCPRSIPGRGKKNIHFLH